MQIHGTTAVITGGASGIGLAIGDALASHGARVILTDIHTDRPHSEVHRLRQSGHDVYGSVCDVTDDNALVDLHDRLQRDHGPVDILVNNAGIGMSGPPYRIPIADWRMLLELNVLSVVRGINAFLPGFVERKHGWLVNVASIGGMYAYDHSDAQLPYVTTKFAVRGMSEALYLNLVPQGVGVSCVCPGRVTTNIAETARLAGTDDPGWIRLPCPQRIQVSASRRPTRRHSNHRRTLPRPHRRR
jgi:NAD(P)-dependent dehydrogenase (short-subunit alcohol dehydrogenase family)